MCPQRSNRARLLLAARRCVEELPPEKITARAIATAAGANLASIGYHFGSKDELVTEAVVTGLDAWLAGLPDLMAARPQPGSNLVRDAATAVERTRQEHLGLARGLFFAVAVAPHNERVRERLVEGITATRPLVADLLDLGDDPTGTDAAGLVLAQFYGLLLQVLVSPALAIDGPRLAAAQARLAEVTSASTSRVLRGSGSRLDAMDRT